jgi:hypothetical protein
MGSGRMGVARIGSLKTVAEMPLVGMGRGRFQSVKRAISEYGSTPWLLTRKVQQNLFGAKARELRGVRCRTLFNPSRPENQRVQFPSRPGLEVIARVDLILLAGVFCMQSRWPSRADRYQAIQES